MDAVQIILLKYRVTSSDRDHRPPDRPPRDRAHADPVDDGGGFGEGRAAGADRSGALGRRGRVDLPLLLHAARAQTHLPHAGGVRRADRGQGRRSVRDRALPAGEAEAAGRCGDRGHGASRDRHGALGCGGEGGGPAALPAARRGGDGEPRLQQQRPRPDRPPWWPGRR